MGSVAWTGEVPRRHLWTSSGCGGAAQLCEARTAWTGDWHTRSNEPGVIQRVDHSAELARAAGYKNFNEDIMSFEEFNHLSKKIVLTQSCGIVT